MALSLQDVQHIANLARLELTQEELSRYRRQLSAILEYFQQIEKLDTEKVPPTASVSAGEAPLRDDQIRPGLELDELLHNAPEIYDRLFRVPPVFE